MEVKNTFERIETDIKDDNKDVRSKSIKSNSPFRNLKRHYSLGPLFYALILAVVIGLSFGMFILKIITKEDLIPANNLPKNDDGDLVISENKAQEPEELAETSFNESFTIAEQSFYVVQTGSFENLESAEEQLRISEELGFAGQLFSEGDRFLSLAGLANSLNTARTIGEKLTNNEIENFPKELSFPAIELSDLSAEDVKFLEKSLSLLDELLLISETILASGSLADDSRAGLVSSGEELAGFNIKDDLKELQQLLVSSSKEITSNISPYSEADFFKLQEQLLFIMIEFQKLN